MIILGLDPGLATTGWGVIEKKGSRLIGRAYGVIRTAPKQPDSKRLAEISLKLTTLINQFSPNTVSIEKLFFQTNVKTAISVAQARGVLLLTSEKSLLPVSEYTPLQVKSAICGYGKADKKQVQYMVMKLLNLDKKPTPDDAADALALAICHSHSVKIKSLT